MKRFDKGYIYYSLLSDFFTSFVLTFLFLSDEILTQEGEINLKLLPIVSIAFVVVFAAFTVYRILFYRTSAYVLDEKEIRCQRGVFFRRRTVLDYQKIHAINKKQNIFQKIFGIATLSVDSGSTSASHQAEIIIIEKSNVVDALLAELHSLRENGVRSSDEVSAKDEVLLTESDSLYRFTSSKKMLYTGITIAASAIITVAIGVLLCIIMSVCYLMLGGGGLSALSVYAVSAVFIVALAALIASIIAFIGCIVESFVAYYDFKITKKDNDISINYGLFVRHTNTFSYDRIKGVKIKQGIIQRIFGFASIRLEVIGYTDTTNESDGKTDIGVLVPFCKYSEVNEILARILPEYTPEPRETRSDSFFPYISWFSLILACVTAVAEAIAIINLIAFNASKTVNFSVLVGILVISIIIFGFKLISSLLAYKTSGISVSNKKITAYAGGFVKTVTVINTKNLIAAENVTTPLRKRAGITTLVLHIKTNALSNEVKVHIQNSELSKKMEELLIL